MTYRLPLKYRLRHLNRMRRRLKEEVDKIPTGTVSSVVTVEMLREAIRLLNFREPPDTYTPVPKHVHFESGGVVGEGKGSKFYERKLRRLKEVRPSRSPQVKSRSEAITIPVSSSYNRGTIKPYNIKGGMTFMESTEATKGKGSGTTPYRKNYMRIKSRMDTIEKAIAEGKTEEARAKCEEVDWLPSKGRLRERFFNLCAQAGFDASGRFVVPEAGEVEDPEDD